MRWSSSGRPVRYRGRPEAIRRRAYGWPVVAGRLDGRGGRSVGRYRRAVPDAESAPPTCAECGTVADRTDPGTVPLGWMVERDTRTGRTTTFCAGCARRHARAIEGKLDQAWW